MTPARNRTRGYASVVSANARVVCLECQRFIVGLEIGHPDLVLIVFTGLLECACAEGPRAQRENMSGGD